MQGNMNGELTPFSLRLSCVSQFRAAPVAIYRQGRVVARDVAGALLEIESRHPGWRVCSLRAVGPQPYPGEVWWEYLVEGPTP